MGEAQKPAHREPFETRRLLKSVADAELRALGDAHMSYIRSVIDYLSRGRLLDAHNELCERGFSAAVRSCYDNELAVVKCEADIVDYLKLVVRTTDREGDIFQFKHIPLPFAYLYAG